MMLRNKKGFEQAHLYPLSIMITVLKDAFTAVSATTTGRTNQNIISYYITG